MLITERKPVSVGEVLEEEFINPLGVTRGSLADAMGVDRRIVDEICDNKRPITVDAALMLAKVFGNTPNFWLNIQQRNDIWTALHTPERMARVEKARPLQEAPA